eukprot:742575-Prorocentrum_minimum.AAC.2
MAGSVARPFSAASAASVQILEESSAMAERGRELDAAFLAEAEADPGHQVRSMARGGGVEGGGALESRSAPCSLVFFSVRIGATRLPARRDFVRRNPIGPPRL